MNHLLHQISWQQYLAAALVAAIIYYLVIFLRYYRPEIENLQRRLSGDRPDNSLVALQYQPDEEEALAAPLQEFSEAPQYHPERISELDILSGQLKACIAKAANKPFAPAILLPQVKHILQQHKDLAEPDRSAINHLIVNECEKTGTALLTESEVDQWWSA